MQRCFIGILAGLFGLLSTFGCAPDRPKVDEKPFLQNLRFYEPITVSVPLDANNGLLALVYKAGYIKVVPSTRGAPWWSFARENGAELMPGTVSVNAGQRVVTNHSDERSWSNRTQQQYAVTITYSIDIDPRLASKGLAHITGYKLRLVLVNDPAVGSWQISKDQTTSIGFEADDVAQKLSAEGQQFLGDVSAAIRDGVTQADKQIAELISQQTGLRVDERNDGVLVSRKFGLAFFRKPTELSDGASLEDAKQYCRTLTLEDLNWDLAGSQEAAKILASVSGSSRIDSLYETLWGSANICPPTSGPSPCYPGRIFVLDSIRCPYCVPQPQGFVDHPTDEMIRTGGTVWRAQIIDNGGGYAQIDSNDYGTDKVAWLRGESTRDFPLCVAKLTQGPNGG